MQFLAMLPQSSPTALAGIFALAAASQPAVPPVKMHGLFQPRATASIVLLSRQTSCHRASRQVALVDAWAGVAEIPGPDWLL